MEIIKIENLSKSYSSLKRKNNVLALDNVSLSVERGKIFGLLGQNGAGKTTLVKILLGLTHPTEGRFSLFGDSTNNYKNKKRIGYLPENHRFPNFLTAYQVLYYLGLLSELNYDGLKRKIFEALELVGLKGVEKKKVKTFSKGMMQRLGIAQAIIHNPDLIFLDEPTDGIDPIGRKEIRDILVRLKNENKTIFLNSHILSEVELITDNVAILHQGKLIKQGSISDLTAIENEYRITTDSELDTFLSKSDFVNFQLKKLNGFTYVLSGTDEDGLNKFVDLLRLNGITIKELIKQKLSLEEIFISLIKDLDKVK
ncbi:MAG: ABC transporter ATP-binding protein [Ignavibacteria bacterium]|jgi:ABC-2 type transport system ATP-binding protein|nr:ABC transporter ATP-binding protein [Ignavibacteria bacterium]MDP3831502.1 ABC transporter ATP-binding protein [Ignavibacteriaceae bacterium]